MVSDVSVLWGTFPTPLLSLSGGDNDLLQSVALSGGVPSACLDAMAVDLCGRTEGGSSRGEAGLGLWVVGESGRQVRGALVEKRPWSMSLGQGSMSHLQLPITNAQVRSQRKSLLLIIIIRRND